MARVIISLFLLSVVCFAIVAQDNASPVVVAREKLEELSRQHRDEYNMMKEEALEYAGKKQIPVKRILDDGRIVELQYKDKKGFPVYHTTFNSEAAATVTTQSLYPEGELELDLTGSGFKIGVWDAGVVDSFHVEFQNRIFPKTDADTPDDHATHVTGTLAASGINPDAKGMAIESEILSYDWNSYLSEMAKEASEGLLVSNQSFGIKLGWTWDDGEWVWNGDPDADEEYLFGFYSDHQSRAIDEIAWLAPNYLMVWAAGNSRAGVGDGSREPNGPFDCIGPEAISKNVLAVGAVEKIATGYTSPVDVRMTGFSSWGPSDDGRVKPDLVAPGVGLFSTIPYNKYDSFSGTSMAAPVVTGSLLLLQELFYKRHGSHMRSATLKALSIHTVSEAGKNRGPDYGYGWGLLNASAAANIIMANDSVSVIIIEDTLDENDVFEVDIFSDGISEITATIVWTDPPGTPAPVGTINPSDLMLVNDIDIRILDEAGNIYYPWILDPDEPDEPANRGDNFRDNVEKILIENPEPRKYTVTISHKDELEGGSQDFSLVISASAVRPSEFETLFWIGEDGEWDDPFNWSLSSGGEPAELIPDRKINVVFDENSFSDSLQTLSLGSDAYISSFSWLVKEGNGIIFGGNDIFIFGNFLVSNEISTSDENGSFIFKGDTGIINAGKNAGSPYSFIFDNINGNWELISELRLDKLLLRAGNIYFGETTLFIDRVLTDGELPKFIDLSKTDLYIYESFDFTGINFTHEIQDSRFIIDLPSENDQTSIKAEDINIPSIEIVQGMLKLDGNMEIEKLINSSSLALYGSNRITKFVLEEGSETWLEGESEQTFSGLSIYSTPENLVSISSLSEDPAKLVNNNFVKLCYDYLSIHNVLAEGKALYVAGENSLLTGETTGWFPAPCRQVPYIEFTIEYPCADARSRFLGFGEGMVKDWFWDFGDENNSGYTSSLQNPYYSYKSTGEYLVTLVASNDYVVIEHEREITIIENTIPENEITFNETAKRYVSTQTASGYQWYNDGLPIPGANERTLDMAGFTGEIRVLLWDEKCNRFSNKLVVSVNLPDLPDRQPAVFPNPADDILYIQYPGSYIGPVLFEVIDISGRVIHSFRQDKSDDILTTSVKSGIFDPGYYLVRITGGREITVKSFIKK